VRGKAAEPGASSIGMENATQLRTGTRSTPGW